MDKMEIAFYFSTNLVVIGVIAFFSYEIVKMADKILK